MANTEIPGLYRCIYCGKTFPRGKQVLGHIVGKHANITRLRKTTVQVRHLTSLQIGYLAAFVDGEGGTQITKWKRKGRAYAISLHPVVYFTNTNREVIHTLRAWLRAGVVVVSRQRPGCKTMYILHVTGIRNIASLLSLLEPHLIVKRRRARLMLQFCRSRLGPRGRVGRKFNQEELKLYKTLRRLNKKGE